MPPVNVSHLFCTDRKLTERKLWRNWIISGQDCQIMRWRVKGSHSPWWTCWSHTKKVIGNEDLGKCLFKRLSLSCFQIIGTQAMLVHRNKRPIKINILLVIIRGYVITAIKWPLWLWLLNWLSLGCFNNFKDLYCFPYLNSSEIISMDPFCRRASQRRWLVFAWLLS